VAVTYRFGEQEVKALAAQAGKAQAAREQVNRRFQKDMAMLGYQMELQKQQRAMAWEIEKMETASRLDFQAKESERIQKQQQFRSALNEIDKRRVSRGGTLPDNVADRAAMNLALQYQGFSPLADELLGLTPYQEQMMGLRTREQEMRERQLALQEEKFRTTDEYLLAQRMQQQQAGITPQQPVTEAVQPSAAQITMPGVSTKPIPLRDIPPSQVPQDNGEYIVLDPESGQMLAITPQEYPEYVERGFLANPILPSGPSFWDKLRPFKDHKEEIGLAAWGRKWKPGYINP